MKSLIPVNKQIILKLISKYDEYKESGIVIPDSVDVVATEGVVFKSDNNDFKPGDIIVYKNYSGFPVTAGDSKYLIIDATDILAKIYEE